jgi:hypothetical protein
VVGGGVPGGGRLHGDQAVGPGLDSR